MGHRQKAEGAHSVGVKANSSHHVTPMGTRSASASTGGVADRQPGTAAVPTPEKEQTHPAPQIPKDPGVVPERHAQRSPPPVVNIFHRRWRSAQPRVGLRDGTKARRQGQHRRHTQSVHRAERQDSRTPSPPAGRPGHGSKQPLQHPSQRLKLQKIHKNSAIRRPPLLDALSVSADRHCLIRLHGRKQYAILKQGYFRKAGIPWRIAGSV